MVEKARTGNVHGQS